MQIMKVKRMAINLIVLSMLVGVVGCSKASENEDVKIPSVKKTEESSTYEEQVVEFEEMQAFGFSDMRVDNNGNVEYASLVQEQLTKEMKAQSYSHIHNGENWENKETKWGKVLKKELEKAIDIKNRMFKINLTFGADEKLYAMFSFYHPDAVLEEKGLDYEYIVSNLLFQVDVNTNKAVNIKIPEATAVEDGKGVNLLKCSAFTDSKLLIQDGYLAYVFDTMTGEKVCEAEHIVNADNYVAGDGVFYSAFVDSDDKFIVCQYEENSGKVSHKFTLETYDAKKMESRMSFMLKVHDYDLYVACKEGIYRLDGTEGTVERVVDGVKSNLSVMANENEYIYNFAVLGDEEFAIDYRRLNKDETDIENYEQESLVYYKKSDLGDNKE